MNKLLNDQTITALESGKIHWFAGVRAQGSVAPRGFGVKVTPAGCRSFVLRYTITGTNRLQVIGRYPDWSVTGAIKEARKLRQAIDRDEDPLGARQAAERAAQDTLTAICEEYFTREGNRLRTADAQKQYLKRLVFPSFGNRDVASIKRSEIVRLMDHISDNNGPVMADAVLNIIRKVLNWHAARSDEFVSPIVRGMARTSTTERARTRILNDDELRAVWRTAETSTDPFGALVRFILLTGARRSEAAEMPWHELDGDIWTLPGKRNKTAQDLVRPLSNAAAAVLRQLKGGVSRTFVFSFGRMHADSSEISIGINSRIIREFQAKTGTAGWTLHDLRRTARSLMSRAKVPADHAERCLGHVIGGVRAVYDRYEYLEEKREAYQALAALIERIVNPAANVVALRA